MSHPIKIMGAGPAGLAAAITLAKHDISVIVYEKADDCGTRFHGDLQGLENWSSKTDIMTELEDIGIDTNFACTPFETIDAVSPQGSLTTFKADSPIVHLVKRGTQPDTLDQGLKQQALDLGVDIRFKSQVAEADVNIVAAGPDSRAIYAIDTGIVFETDMDNVAYGMLNNDSAYLGYSYLLVTNGYGCMCTVLFDRYPEIHRQFARVKKMFIELTGVKIKNPTTVGGYGTFTHQPKYTQQNRLYVGEAAGLQDLLWGFGIRYALRSGNLAAKALMGNGDYAQMARRAFSNSLQASVVNRCVWEYLGDYGYHLFLTMGRRSKDPKQFLYKIFSYTPLRRFAFPLALWDLRRRHRPLPY